MQFIVLRLSIPSRCRRAAVPPHTTMASDVNITTAPPLPSTIGVGDADSSPWLTPSAHQTELTVFSKKSTSTTSHRALHVRRSLTNMPPKYYPIYCYMLHAIETLFCVLSVRTLGSDVVDCIILLQSLGIVDISMIFLLTRVAVYCASKSPIDWWDVLILDVLGRWIGLLRMSLYRVLHVRRSLTNMPPKHYPIYCYMLHAIETLFCVLSVRTLGGDVVDCIILLQSLGIVDISMIFLQFLVTVYVCCASKSLIDGWDVLIMDVLDRGGDILLMISSSLSLHLRVCLHFYDNLSTKYLSTDCYTPHAIESSCVQLIVASMILTLRMLVWIFDLLGENMRAGYDLSSSNCKRFVRLLNGYNAHFRFLRFTKLPWMGLNTA